MTGFGEAPPVVLSIVVPVFNQAASIVQNLQVIHDRVAERLGDEEFELVVVSDGSIDSTEDELLAQRGNGNFRVFHYDRNLGKGYAVKIGSLEASGEWIGYIDADLDLDPADLAVYLQVARQRALDFAIGSKRHPDSRVHYPRSRIVASWLFQQLVRLLFRLDVRDTQVGLKVFRRAVADQVLPLLLTKRYAFDIELLAVSHAFGFDRIEELPITLEYRFAGSGVRSRAVLRALVDTAAIFYRLRILRYYQRRRAIAGPYGWTRPRTFRPFVSVLLPAGSTFRERDYPNVEICHVADPSMLRNVAANAHGEVLAILEPGARPAANWVSATTPFFARGEVTAVVTPKMSPLHGKPLALAAAAVDESRLGGGLGYFRYTPGNVRFVDDFPGGSILIRSSTFSEIPPQTGIHDVVRAITAAGGRVLYTPESVVVSEPPSLFRPHLRAVFARGRRRSTRLRENGGVLGLGGLSVVLAVGVLGVARVSGATWGEAFLTLAALYAIAVTVAAAAASLRFQSLRVGALTAAGVVATHIVYLAGLFSGLVRA